eukprot:1796216-Prymnesium_polylepis.1
MASKEEFGSGNVLRQRTPSLFAAPDAPAASDPLFVSWAALESTRPMSEASARDAEECTDVSKEHWVPEENKYYLVVDGEGIKDSCRELTGPCGGDMLKTVLNCPYFEAVPCTKGTLGAAGAVLWMDEEARMSKGNNEVATRLFGEQVYGGELYGEVILRWEQRGLTFSSPPRSPRRSSRRCPQCACAGRLCICDVDQKRPRTPLLASVSAVNICS